MGPGEEEGGQWQIRVMGRAGRDGSSCLVVVEAEEGRLSRRGWRDISEESAAVIVKL